VGVAFSQDGGHTWTSRSVLLAPQASVGFAPDAATTRSGHLYLAYPTAANRVGVARSLDHGASWTVFGDVAAPAGIQGSAFHQAVAGDDGRVAVAFLGTTATGNPFASSFNGVWLLHASVTFDGGTTWTTASTGPNVIQRGWICAAGTACGSGRNLFESMDAALDARGLVHVALADGCVGVCDGPSGTKAQSTSTWATLVVQTGGTDLIAP
jgi:hypothetical protein